MTEVRDGSGSLISSYYYDPFGRRLWKEVSGARTYFHYADEGLIGEYDATGVEIKTYGYKPGSTWTTDPLFMKVGTNYYFYQNDHLETPQKMTTVNGAVVWSAKYSSFGKCTVDGSSTVTNNLRFPGQYADAESGLHYNYYRYYDPELGRYLRADPIHLNGGFNFFRYSLNNPISKFDSKGLFCKTLFSITIPMGSSLESSNLVSEGKWELRVSHAEIAFGVPGTRLETLWEIITNPTFKSGAAICSAVKKFIYQDTYASEGLRLEAGFCVDKCFGTDFWSRSQKVIIDRFTKDRTVRENDTTQIQIQVASGSLADYHCQKWVDQLNSGR